MLLTMLLFALGNIPLLAWIKARKSKSSGDAAYSMHSSASYGSFSRDSTSGHSDTSSHSPATRDLNWFERMDASVLKQVFRR
jgi:hypothetical protein